jgi:hypothetical protein
MSRPKSIIFLGLLLIIVIAAVVLLNRDDPIARIKQEAQICAKATVDGDFTTLLAHTQKRVVDLMGGKDAVVTGMTQALKQLRDQGIKYDHITIGNPASLQKIGSLTVSLVPEEIVLKAEGGQMEMDSNMLAFSEDSAKTWSFVDLSSLSAEQFFKIYPELSGQFIFPVKSKPRVTQDKK